MSKQRVIVEAVLSGKSQTEVARLYGISQPRVSQLVAAWRAGGWDALEPKSRRPRSNPNATPPDVVTRILALRTELIADGCDAGPHSIAGILEDEMPTPPGVTTIWRILPRAGAITPEPRKRPKRSWIRFAADLPAKPVDHIGVHRQSDGANYVGAAPVVGRVSGTQLSGTL